MEFTSFDYSRRQEEYIENIITFVYTCLNKWRDNKIWSINENEKILNSSLAKNLTGYVRSTEIKAHFFSEEPQGNKRTIDIVACHYDSDIENFDDAITVFECKRLTTNIERERKDEYVTGHKNTSGGIQRFKLEAHGKEHKIVGMIGYIQTGTYLDWQTAINNCIDDLCGKPDENGLCWNEYEHLNTIEYDNKNNKYHGKSLHQRKTKPDITIHHLWINMQQ